MPQKFFINMSKEKQHRLMEWWNATEQGTVVVKRLVSFVTELRLHPESSRVGGMILFYRAVSEVSYGYAGMRGCIRRAYSNEYSQFLQNNIVRCHSFAKRFSVDSKVLLERVAKQISGGNALLIVDHIREALRENDIILSEIENKAIAFFGNETFQSLQSNLNKSSSLSSS